MDSNFVIVNDPHLSDVAPASRIDDYFEAILLKIEFAAKYCISKSAIMLVLGDIFHQKNPRKVSHHLVNRLIAILKPVKQVIMVRGNHDQYMVDLNEEKSPLTVLQKAGIITILNGEPIRYNNVSINGFSWTEDREIVPHMYEMTFLKDCKWNVGLYHQYVIPDEEQFMGPHVSFSQVFSFLPQISIFGHFHDAFSPAAKKVGDKILINVGALAREKATKQNLVRAINIGYLVLPDDGRPRFALIKVPAREASVVFDLTRKRLDESDTERLEQFVNHFGAEIEKVKVVDPTSLEDLLGLIDSLKLSPVLAETTKTLLSEAREEMI